MPRRLYCSSGARSPKITTEWENYVMAPTANAPHADAKKSRIASEKVRRHASNVEGLTTRAYMDYHHDPNARRLVDDWDFLAQYWADNKQSFCDWPFRRNRTTNLWEQYKWMPMDRNPTVPKPLKWLNHAICRLYEVLTCVFLVIFYLWIIMFIPRISASRTDAIDIRSNMDLMAVRFAEVGLNASGVFEVLDLRDLHKFYGMFTEMEELHPYLSLHPPMYAHIIGYMLHTGGTMSYVLPTSKYLSLNDCVEVSEQIACFLLWSNEWCSVSAEYDSLAYQRRCFEDTVLLSQKIIELPVKYRRDGKKSIGILGSGNSKGDGPCPNCGEEGHALADCQAEGQCVRRDLPAATHAKPKNDHHKKKISDRKDRARRCYACGGIGHLASDHVDSDGKHIAQPQTNNNSSNVTVEPKKKFKNSKKFKGGRVNKDLALLGRSISESLSKERGNVDANIEVQRSDDGKSGPPSNVPGGSDGAGGNGPEDPDGGLRPTRGVQPEGFRIYYLVPQWSSLVHFFWTMVLMYFLQGLVRLAGDRFNISWRLILTDPDITLTHRAFGELLIWVIAFLVAVTFSFHLGNRAMEAVEQEKFLMYDQYIVEFLRPELPPIADLRPDAISVGKMRHTDPKLWRLAVKICKPNCELLSWLTFGTFGYKRVERVISVEVASQIMTFAGTNPHLEFQELSKKLHIYAATLHSVNVDRYNIVEGTDVYQNTLEFCLLRVCKNRLRHGMMKNFPWAPVQKL